MSRIVAMDRVYLKTLLLVCPLASLTVSFADAQQRRPSEVAIRLLQRMDRNRDGQLDHNEVPASSSSELQQLANRAGLSTDQPWPISRLAAQLRQDSDTTDSAQQRDADDASQPPRRRRARQNGENDAGADGFSSSSNGSSVREFGTGSDSQKDLESRFNQRILSSVDRFLRQYDRNDNGQLDREEWSAVRWGDDPEESDDNGDGMLSREELSERMAKRWGITTREEEHSSENSRGFSSSSESGSTTSGNDATYRKYAKALIKNYDKNNNGVLEKSEVRRRYQPADVNDDGIITLDELVVHLAGYQRSTSTTANSGRATDRSSRGEDSRDRADRRRDSRRRFSRARDWRGRRDRGRSRRDEDEREKKSYRFLTPIERLEDLLSRRERESFIQLDRNRDGQIAMAEFTDDWTRAKVREFSRLDENGDGLITPHEYRQAD